MRSVSSAQVLATEAVRERLSAHPRMANERSPREVVAFWRKVHPRVETSRNAIRFMSRTAQAGAANHEAHSLERALNGHARPTQKFFVCPPGRSRSPVSTARAARCDVTAERVAL